MRFSAARPLRPGLRLGMAPPHHLYYITTESFTRDELGFDPSDTYWSLSVMLLEKKL